MNNPIAQSAVTLAAVLFLLGGGNGFAAEHPPTKASAQILATVDGRAITLGDVTGVQPAAADNIQLRNQVLQQYINTLLIAEHARAIKLDQTPAAKEAFSRARLQVLVQLGEAAWLREHPISDDAVRAAYAKLGQEASKVQFRYREIVVADGADAAAVMAALRGGRRFTDLAESHPLGPNATLGGELGWVDASAIPAAIEESLRMLKPGDVTGPIVVPQGVAIVQLLGRRPAQLLPLSAVQPSILQQLRGDSLGRYIGKLRGAADVKIYK